MATVLDIVLSNAVLAAGVSGSITGKTQRTQNQAGYVQTNIVWTQPLRQFEFNVVPLLPADWNYLARLFEVTGRGAYGFLIEDPTDRACTHTDGVVLKVGDDWVLHKRYAEGAYSEDRKITRPRAVSFLVEGVAATGTVEQGTGIVTWTGDVPADDDEVTWAGMFYVPVQFTNDAIDWQLVRGGAFDGRLIVGPSVQLTEVRE